MLKRVRALFSFLARRTAIYTDYTLAAPTALSSMADYNECGVSGAVDEHT